MKRILLITAAAVLTLLIAVSITLFLLVRSAGKKGTSTIETWLGSQVQSICSAYLKPRLSFNDLDYQYPGTLLLKNFRLTSPDPAHPGQNIDILAAKAVSVQLAQIPSIGQPIKIERITLDHPLLQAVAADSTGHQFIGFSDLLKAPTETTSRPSAAKLSEIFQMRLVELNGGRLVYDPRRPDQPPMELDDIHTRLDIQPTDDGWYALHTTLQRRPALDLSIAGQFNLDTFDIRDLNLALNTQLGSEDDRTLPPQLQQLLKEHAVHGDLELTLTGSLPLLNFRQGNLQTLLKLRRAKVEVGQYNLALDWMRLSAQLADGKVNVDSMDLTALGGSAHLKATIALNDQLDTYLRLTASRMTLEDLLLTPPGQQPAFGGRLNAQVRANAPLTVVLAHLAPPASPTAKPLPPLPSRWGEGFIELDHGRLMQLPAIQQLAKMMGNRHADRPEDQALAIFTLSADRVRLGRIAVAGSWFAVRGQGTIGLNQRLDLTLNGGPLEKIESLFGQEADRALSRLTDSLASYNVRGTLDDPRIVMRAGGRKMGSGLQRTGEEIGKGATDLGRDVGRTFRGLFGN